MRAADCGDVEAVDSLLRSGADQSTPTRSRSPQRLAMRHGHIEVLRLLQHAGGDEQQLGLPVDAGADTVVLRWYYPKAYWMVLAAVPAVVGLVIGAVQRSGTAVVSGLIVSAVGGVLAFLVVGLNGLERFAFDGNRFWYRPFKKWHGPVDLRTVRAAYLVPASSGARLYLLQDDAGVTVAARASQGFDADSIAALNETHSLRALGVMANTSSLYPGYLAEIARYALASDAVIDNKARALFDRALADEAAMRVGGVSRSSRRKRARTPA